MDFKRAKRFALFLLSRYFKLHIKCIKDMMEDCKMDIKKRVDKYSKVLFTYSGNMEVLLSIPNMNKYTLTLNREDIKEPATVKDLILNMTASAVLELYEKGINLIRESKMAIPDKSSYLQIRFYDENKNRITESNVTEIAFAEATFLVLRKDKMNYVIRTKLDAKDVFTTNTSLIRYDVLSCINNACKSCDEKKEMIKTEYFCPENGCWKIAV